MKLSHYLAVLAFITAGFCYGETSKSDPFPHGALTEQQLLAWNYYVVSEAAVFGCEYGDDPRLEDSPEVLLRSLAQGETVEPVRVTYRTLVNSGPNTRNLLMSNMYVASIECNPVYFSGSELIGLPVIPFEEALTILHDDYAAHKSDERIQALLRSFHVATIDPRWFWAYFLVDKAHNDILGYDYDTLLELERVVSGAEEKSENRDEDIGLIHRIFRHLNYNKATYFSSTGQCDKDPAEPAMDIIVWKEIGVEYVQKFYRFSGIDYDGKWRRTVKKTEGGYNLLEERPVDNPAIPYFNVSRGMRVYSTEC